MTLSSVLVLSFLGTACAPPQDTAPERAPYVAFLDEVEQGEADTVRAALARVPGVARVELEVDSGKATLHAKADSYVARVHVEMALDDIGLARFDEPSWSKVMVYVVTTNGGGWGAGPKAREAYAKLKNVDAMLVSGTRATFTLKEGHFFSEKEVAEVLKGTGLTLAGFRKEERTRAVTAYELGTKPVTWAGTCAKVRETLLENESILDAFVGETIVLHVANIDTLPEAFVRDTMKDAKIEFEAIEKNAKRLF